MTQIARRAARKPPRPPKVYVDFNDVPPEQRDMDARLDNWRRAQRGGDKQAGSSSPMFMLYQSSDAKRREYGTATVVPVDRWDAQIISMGVNALPDKPRAAIQWYYGRNAQGAADKARSLGVDVPGLRALLIEARATLIETSPRKG